MFDPHSPHFNKINLQFLQEQQNNFGADSFTAQSTFNEDDPKVKF